MSTDLAAITVRNQVDTYGGPETGTEYDLCDACSRCGTGAIQVGPLRLRLRNLPKHDIWITLDFEFVVSERLAQTLLSSGCQCLTQAVTSRAGSPLPLWQLCAQATLPRFSPETSGFVRERPCPACDCDGYFGIPHVPTRLVYPKGTSFSSECQLFATFERFGNSRLREPFCDSVFAAPLYVAAGPLLASLAKAAPRGLEFESVTVSDVPPNPSLQRTNPGHSPGICR